MQVSIEASKGQSNRNTPVEKWPESVEILRHLAMQSEAQSVRQVSRDVKAPEITTRGRLLRLQASGAVLGFKAQSILPTGKPVYCMQYLITPYGRDCAAMRNLEVMRSARPCVNSVFALGWAME
jgi:hypothetical protein